MATVELTKDNIEDLVKNNPIVMVDFWASWCGPCRAFSPIFEQASEKHRDITFAKCDTEDQQELAASFGIRSIPTLMVFKEGVLLFQNPGALPAEELTKLIEKVTDLDMDSVRDELKKQSNNS